VVAGSRHRAFGKSSVAFVRPGDRARARSLASRVRWSRGHTGRVSEETVRRRVVVWGVVQGVGYRWTCAREAARLGVAGGVRNLGTGDVEIVAEGGSDAVERLVAWARRGPSGAEVRGVQVTEEEPRGASGFRVES